MSPETNAHQTDLPGGTVTFLFTDIQGSTDLLKQLGESYATLLADQRGILRTFFEKYNGTEIDTQGDAFFASFPRATQAVAAVVEIQRELAAHDWPSGVEVRVRMGLHTGEPWLVEEGYVGMDVHRAARIAHVGHGGQVLLSETTAPLVQDELPDGVTLLDLGRHRLKDMRRPEWIHQLMIEGLPGEFPPLKSLEMLPPAISLDFGEIKLPVFLEEQKVEIPPPVFVGREREMTRLDGYFDQVHAGQGGVVFITGGPGRGKTALMQTFSRQAMEAHPDLLVAAGKCNAYTGAGDPYHPFRDVLGDLTGDVEAKWAVGGMSSDQAKRLWQVLPETAQAIVDYGPDLVDVFIPGKDLLSRVSLALPEERTLHQSLQALTGRKRATPGELEQKALFKQYLKVLVELSAKYTLLILLDDLQWADSASLNLLFHLGREIPGSRILLVGAYRPEEVALGRGGERHPLEETLAELKRQYGDAWIDLSQTPEGEDQRFVDDLIDSEPNHLGGAFRKALLAHTEGHPLFTIELIREMQVRGDLVQDKDGYWVEGGALNWNLLPARVEGVIEVRIGRLENELREILTIASVEGEDFTAQVIARVKEASERGLVRQLSGELDKVHRLVGERGIFQVADHQLYLYRFRHSLFQQHLYNGIGEIERKLLHKDVGNVLEVLYREQREEVATQLAWHFSEAGEADKAIHYLLLSGDRAHKVFAYQEAIEFYRRAIEFLKRQGGYELAARTLMKLGLIYRTTFDFERSRQAYNESFLLTQQYGGLQPPSPISPSPDPLRMSIIEPIGLDPGFAIDSDSAFVIKQIFSGLLQLRPDMSVVPDLARKWEVFEDGRKIIFYLRGDTYWSDGEPVKAQDYEYAWKRCLDPEKQGSSAQVLYDVKGAKSYHLGIETDPSSIGVRTLDDLTLFVELEKPSSYFMHLVANHTAWLPVPAHIVQKHGWNWVHLSNLVTNGPFRMTSWEKDEMIILERNLDYPGPFHGNLQRVECLITGKDSDKDSDMELTWYEEDQIDFLELSLFTPSRADALRQRYASEYIILRTFTTSFIIFDHSKPPFNDKRVRQAFSMAIDRETLAEVGMKGFVSPAVGGIVPAGMPGHAPGVSLPYDPERARGLLADAGYDGRQYGNMLSTQLWTRRDYADYIHAIEPLISQLSNNLGINIEWKKTDFASLLQRAHKGNTPLMVVGWDADYFDPDNFLRVAVASWKSRWDNETFDALIETARQLTDQQERMQSYVQAERILAEEAPIIPLFYFHQPVLLKPWVRRLSVFFGLGSFYFKDVIIEPH